jgi:Dyp-type peroxidase family
MSDGTAVLEAPASTTGVKATAATAQKEPRLETDQIQGNIIPGFLKDYRTMLFLRINDVPAFRVWLKAFIPFIATADEVLAFNRLFKAMRFRRKTECHTVKATWINAAFTFAGLQKIAKAAGSKVDVKFKDEAFKEDVRDRSQSLGDPRDPKAEGHVNNWRVGGEASPEERADFLLILESDSQNDLFNEVERIENLIFAFRAPDGIDGAKAAKGGPADSGLSLVYKQNGATLPGSLTGHEHFGFRDGVSQPGIRGTDRFGTLITAHQNPNEPDDQGKPGQDLLWPGEFVFGYPGQIRKGKEDITPPGPDRFKEGEVPKWAKNGSYLVFRRLRQDVGRFHRFLKDVGKAHGANPDLVGARLVGRWASGAPTVISPDDDTTELAENDCLNNNFEFGGVGAPTPAATGKAVARLKTQPAPGARAVGAKAVTGGAQGNKAVANKKAAAKGGNVAATPVLHPAVHPVCENVPEAAEDPQGLSCPFAGHIRKAYPRNDQGTADPNINEVTTQTHRLLRRGIPWGPPSSSTPHAPLHDDTDRGLLFMCYQTSIVDQFEFVTQMWVNNRNFKDRGAGHDMIIGQNGDGNRDRACKIHLPGAGGQQAEVEIKTQDFPDPQRKGQNDWVIPTGGGYFFSPSIDGLRVLAGDDSKSG